jgi:hypothetical protein
VKWVWKNIFGIPPGALSSISIYFIEMSTYLCMKWQIHKLKRIFSGHGGI